MITSSKGCKEKGGFSELNLNWLQNEDLPKTESEGSLYSWRKPWILQEIAEITEQ